MGLHVKGKSCVNSPPIAGDIQENEKEKEDREKNN